MPPYTRDHPTTSPRAEPHVAVAMFLACVLLGWGLVGAVAYTAFLAVSALV